MEYGPAAPPEKPEEHLPCELLHTLAGHEGPVLAVRFNRLGTYCLTCGKDRAVKLWNPHRGVLIKTYTGHGYDVRDAAVSHDNSKFASCGGDRQVFLWDVSSGATIRKFRGHDGAVNALAYAPDSAVLASGGYDSAVKVWDGRSRSIDPVQSIKAAADSITAVVVNDRAQILASSVDGTLRRFDVRMGALYTDSLHHPVTDMAASADGECTLVACTDGALRLLDRGSGQLLAQYSGHIAGQYKVECGFTPSDAHVLAASEDGRLCYWELVDARLVKSFQAHASVLCSLAVHPEGRCVLTSSVDGEVRVWQ